MKGSPKASTKSVARVKRAHKNPVAAKEKTEFSTTMDEVVDENTGSEAEVPTTKPNRSLDSYYAPKVGYLQALSLILNAGLMIYAHVGLSGVIVSSQDPAITSGDGGEAPANNSTNSTGGACTEADVALWTDYGGSTTRGAQSNFCSREYNGNGCLTTVSCIAECFETTYGYTASCSACFGEIPACGVRDGCFAVCAADSVGEECETCNGPCIAEMLTCSGLPDIPGNSTTTTADETRSRYLHGDHSHPHSHSHTDDNSTCNNYDLEAVETWYNVYDVTFVRSVNDAWNGGAKLLAVIIVLFSGFWPYAKNVILLLVWYIPMSTEWQSWTILWLARLSKYTIVDVFAVIMVLVGVQLQLDVGGTEAITRAEPRFGILAFFLATVWEYLQIELVKVMHEDKVRGKKKNEVVADTTKEEIGQDNSNNGSATSSNSTKEGELEEDGKLFFPQLWIPAGLLVLSIGLYVSGSILEIVQFTSTDINVEQSTCTNSYNLISLADALINDLSLSDGNSAAWQTWILYLIYIVLNLVLPIFVHLLQMLLIFRWKTEKPRDMEKLQRLSLWISAMWCFAGIEVLLLGVFAIEFKFAQLVDRIAGETNKVFLDISSGLGPGFYLLIAYSVVAGFLQFTLRVSRTPSTTNNVETTSNQKGEGDGV
eukprot:scaffold10310_cov81-Cylindrotheca_fusiformis.AAC.3